MSQPDPAQHSVASDDHAAAQAFISHHTELLAGLSQRVDALLDLVAGDHPTEARAARKDLLGYLRREIVPHAVAEEQALYPLAAARTEGRALVEGMLGEHRALTALVEELAGAGSLVRAAAAGRALAAVFAVHLAKENDLVLPLLVGAHDVSLAEVLTGMHQLLGGDAAAATPPTTSGHGDRRLR